MYGESKYFKANMGRKFGWKYRVAQGTIQDYLYSQIRESAVVKRFPIQFFS